MTEPPSPSPARSPRLSLRIDLPNGGRIGPGKIRLLEAVAETGSISAAGRALGMSYRRAWLLVDALNKTFTTPVATASAGGSRGGGAAVTAFGQQLIAAYRSLEAESLSRTEAVLAAQLAMLGDRPVGPTGEDEPAA